MNKLQRILNRIIEHPKVFKGRLKGLQSDHLLCCLTARDFVNQDFKTIIDVGANEGVFIDVCNYLFPDSKIYAFEPIPKYYDIVKNKNVEHAFNFGLWDKAGEDILYCNSINMGASSFLEPTKQYKKDKCEEKDLFKITSKRFRFDELIIKICYPCFVKIDVEGAEEKVIRGFGDKLKEIDVLQIEWFFKKYHKDQMDLGSLLPLLEEAGFNGFIQREFNYINGSPATCDLIFFKTKSEETK